MRIVTGCTRKSNIANLYKDCGWESLNSRRDKHILKMFYRIVNGQAPKYLIDILPPKVMDIVPYPVRNANDFIIPRYRVETFKRSFIVYGAGLWN